MAVAYLISEDLIASVKRRAAIPINQNTFTDQDILDMANEEMMIGMVPSILQLHEEFFVVTQLVDLEADQANYPIPSRAIGNKLRQLSYVDTSGNTFEMARIQPETKYDSTRSTGSNNIYRFMVQNNEVVLVPRTSASPTGQLEMNFYLRPNALVKSNRAGIISNIDRNTGIISVEAFPTVFEASVGYDFVKIGSPHKIYSYDIVPTTIDPVTKTLTFDPDEIPEQLVEGDTVMLAGETIVPNIPTDLHVVLAHRVATRCLEAQGDTAGLQNANLKLQEMEFKTGELIDNRVEGSPQKVINRNTTLQAGKLGRRRNWM